jgi:hypothetical protein
MNPKFLRRLVSKACEVHGYHWPMPFTLHVHHLWPLGMGGPDVAWNKLRVCPTGHFNIHAALAALVFGKPLPKVTRNELQAARKGYDGWVAAGKPGNPHAAYALVHAA